MLGNYLKEKEKLYENIRISLRTLISKPKYTNAEDVINDDKITNITEKELKIYLIYLINIISNSIIKIVECIFRILSN